MRDLADLAVELALKMGADYAEARYHDDKANFYVLRNGVPEMAGFERSRGIGIRVLVQGSLGFSSLNRPDKALLERRVKEAISMAKASARVRKKPIRFSEEKAEEASWEARAKEPFEGVPVEEKMELLFDLEKVLTSKEEVGVQVPFRLLELIESTTERYFVNSEGARISCRVPRVEFLSIATAFEPGKGTEQDMVQEGASKGWEFIRELKPGELLKERTRALGKVLKEGVSPPKGTIDIILGSEVVGLMVHESCGHPYEADRIMGREAAQAGESFVSVDMLGQRIGTEVVTVVDDPTLEGSYGYYLYDDEGVKARRRYLIKDGVINEFLHNRETAAVLGISSNAAARASGFNREPIVRMANTFMLPGDCEFEELIEDVKLGVYIKTFGEWNIDDRRFNMRFIGRESYLIENGEIKGPVRRPVLEITTPGFYGSIDALDKNLAFSSATCGKGDPVQGVPVWLGGPNVRLRNVRLGGL
ncbi:TldD-like protein [Candidatus Bathyarchaeota archaeon ex4484_135]|nr:MAG: TldD-like protein [Candidatus Bathyarchaeota archaeon ex4484_135]